MTDRALRYTTLARRAGALDALEAAAAQRDGSRSVTVRNPAVDPLRNEARFQGLTAMVFGQ